MSLGLFFVAIGLYSIIVFLIKPRKSTHSVDFENHEYFDCYHDDFDDEIDDYSISFKKEASTMSTGQRLGGTILVFHYIVRVHFQRELNINLRIARRGKLGVLIWLFTNRFRANPTGNKYIDSRYTVNCDNELKMKYFLSTSVLNELEYLDINYKSIRSKLGKFYIFDNSVCYYEGPYHEDYITHDPQINSIYEIINDIIQFTKLIERK